MQSLQPTIMKKHPSKKKLLAERKRAEKRIAKEHERRARGTVHLAAPLDEAMAKLIQL